MAERMEGITREIHRAGESAICSEYYVADAAELAERLIGRFAGQVKLIYLDPPFQTGRVFEARVRVGEKEWRSGHGSLTLPAYEDRLSRDDYLLLMRRTLTACKQLLTADGLIFLHIDWRMHPYLRLLMDEIFGESNFLNEIVWSYQTGGSARKYFPRKHDNILMYAKTKNYDFHILDVAEPSVGGHENHMKRHVDADGRVYRSIRSGGRVYTYYDDDPVVPGDVWSDVSHLQQKDPRRTGYDTQKPLKLLERIVKCASRPGDIVLDLFSGSGTTFEAAYLGNRRFIGGDSSPLAMQYARRRTEGAACEFTHPAFSGNPACDAYAERGVAFTRVNLRSFALEEGVLARELPGLDAVDSWAAGYVRDGAFHFYAGETRSREKPSLKGTALVPVYEGELAIRVSDVTGRDFYYRVPESAGLVV